MNFLFAIPICVALMTSYNFGFPVEESEQIMSTTQSSSSSTTSSSSSSYFNNIFDFSGLTKRFKSWSGSDNKASSLATNESAQICEKKEVVEESQTQSSSKLELEKSSSQYSASAQDSTYFTENQETAINDQSAIIEKTSVRKKKESKSIEAQAESTFQSTDINTAAYSQAEIESESTRMSNFQNERTRKSLSKDSQSQIINEDKSATLECASVAETNDKNPPHDIDCETTAVSQVAETENVSILDSISKSVSSMMSTSSSSDSQSQTINFTGTTQEDSVAASESVATVDITAGGKAKKMKSALVQEDSGSQTSQTEVAAFEQTSECESKSISESRNESVLSTRDMSTSIGSLDVADKIAVAECTTTAETFAGSEKKKRKSVQANAAIQATDMKSVMESESTSSTLDSFKKQDKTFLQTQADSISQGIEAEAVTESCTEGVSKDVSIKEKCETSSKVKDMEIRNSQNGIEQSLNIDTMNSNQENISSTNSIAVSDVVSDCGKNKKNASQAQTESMTEIENTTQSTSHQAETKSESFFSSVVNDASNMVYGSEKSDSSACSKQDLNSSMQTENESAVVSESTGILESITETVTTITSSVLSSSSSSTTESSAMKSESVSGTDVGEVEAISISKPGACN